MTEEIKKKAIKNDSYKGIFWGILLIYLGIFFLFVENNFLSGDDLFSYFLFGLGILMIGDYFLRYFFVSLVASRLSKLILGLIFLMIGASQIFYLRNWWPLLLVMVGAIMVWSSFRKRTVHVS